MIDDVAVRRAIYERALKSGTVPALATIADDLGAPQTDVAASVQRLAEGHVLVLQPDGEILMAAPFSAVPTGFVVTSGELRSFGNCVWDAFGILAMLHRDGSVATACGCCGMAMTIDVESGHLRSSEGAVHYAVAAREWWSDIVFT